MLPLADHATRDDLRIYLERLLRAGQPEVRLVTRGGALAVFGCTQAPQGITDQVPVVLVMRAFALRNDGGAEGERIDVTVQARALLDRIARLGIVGLELDIPDVTAMAAWAGVLPPTAGWEPVGVLDAASVRRVANEGIERVAAALPADPGEAVVRRVRASVWGAEMAPGIPAAAAFAAEALGFLGGASDGAAESASGGAAGAAGGPDPVRVARSLTWTRLTSGAGHVLVRSLLG